MDQSSNYRTNHPKIFTFNYDCLLEKMIIEHLFATTGMSKDEAIEYVDKLSIHHIYGSIDSYRAKRPLDVYKKTNSISVIGDDRESHRSKIQFHLREALRGCARVYFLGFGFDRYNCQLLNGDGSQNSFAPYDFQNKAVFTDIGLSTTTITEAKSILNNYILDNEGHHSIGCEELLFDKFPINRV